MKVQLMVIFGGKSVEHEISVISALQAMENLNADKYDIIPMVEGITMYRIIFAFFK